MPLSRLMLALLGAVICTTEFSTSEAKLPQQSSTLLWQHNTSKSKGIIHKSSSRVNRLHHVVSITPSTTTARFVNLSSHAPTLDTTKTTSLLSSALTKDSINLFKLYAPTLSVDSESYAANDERPLTQNLVTTYSLQPAPSATATTIQYQPKISSAFLSISTLKPEECMYSSSDSTLDINVNDDGNGKNELATPLPDKNEQEQEQKHKQQEEQERQAQQALVDLLTKGFAIPTFLPPFPSVFTEIELPERLNKHPIAADTIKTSTGVITDIAFIPNVLSNNSQENFSRNTNEKNSKVITTNITVQIGNYAYLPCQIYRLTNKPVSWVRLRDGHIISVDQTTFIADQRFRAIHQDDDFSWSLQIKFVDSDDEGWYECQVSAEPKMRAKAYLKVVVPLTELIGEQNRFVRTGSKVSLHCRVRGTLDTTKYIIWFHNETRISDDNILGWYTHLRRNLSHDDEEYQNTIGSLVIPFVRKTDSGNYTCQPSNSASASFQMRVLNGK
uniref:Ig-like domain-containing protein n=1 Tax=Glossina brevipalpis TaxID=37001 RepID=A0A1A9VZD5_9MUSC